MSQHTGTRTGHARTRIQKRYCRDTNTGLGGFAVNDSCLEVRKLPDGRAQARRRDGQPLTDQDRQNARRLADALLGVTPADVLRVFPGARVLSPAEAAALMAANGLPQ